MPSRWARHPDFVRPRCYERVMSAECRECRAGLNHCHGTIIRHSLGRFWSRLECTEPDCEGPELLVHTFVIDCDAVGCGCTESVAQASDQSSAHRVGA